MTPTQGAGDAPTPAAGATIYLLRHGRTPLNADHRLRGRIDTPLDEVGIREAKALGELFASVRLMAVAASPLSRAVDTAAAVAATHDLEVERSRGLVDRDWGPWAGSLETEVVARFGRTEQAPGIEPFDAFRRRTVEAVEALASRAQGAAIVAVAHDAVNRAVLAALSPHLGPSIGQRTGCWNLLRREPSGWTVPVVDARPGEDPRP